jgi:alpha-galactosidase
MSQYVAIGNGQFTLNIRLPERGMPEITSFAKPPVTPGPLFDIARSSRINGMDKAVPSCVFLPTGGMGNFGWPALCGHRAGHHFILSFTGWTVTEGKTGTTLAATDPLARIAITIRFETHSGGVISSTVTLRNDGDSDYMLDRAMAGSLPVPAGPAEVTFYTGMWGREFQTRKETLGESIWSRESRRGRTSHDRPPLLFVEAGGTRFGVTLGWSGNHQIVIDRLDDGRRMVHAGELFEPGEMILKPGESYQSPTLYAGEDSAAFHAFLRCDLLAWPNGAMKPRPVTLNTWEGNYFDHQLESLKAQATAAAEIGIERFVLDDGWFGKRDDDTTSLGDWDIDPRKYPDGLKPLVRHVTDLGMEFGIWFEPEMINEESALFRAHPDWVLQVEGLPRLPSRFQQVLDIGRPEVSDYLFEKIDAVLKDLPVAYIKWDMNRDLTHAGGKDGTARMSSQTRAFYALLDRVRAAHPGVEIESCASGGGRIDYGVIARTHRVWTSDCTDALERLEIQRGASSFLPPEIMGAHVSASPNHQTGRIHSLSFRALVAMAYHLGVELNPLTLGDDEKQELAGLIAIHKELRPLLHKHGANFSLDPVDGRYVWGAADESRIALFVAQGPQMVGEQPAPLLLPEHVAALGGRWKIARVTPAMPDFIRTSGDQMRLLSGEIAFSLQDLARAGLPLPMLRPESAMLIEFSPV